MLMIKTYRLNKTKFTMPIRKCHSLCSKCPPLADTQQRRHLRHSSMVSSITRCGIADHASTNWCFSLHCCVSAEGGHFEHKLGHLRRHCEFEWFCSACTFLSLTLWLLLTEQIHKYMHNWMALLFSCGKVTTLNRCGEQHNINMLQIFSGTFLPNIVQFGQHLAKLFSK